MPEKKTLPLLGKRPGKIICVGMNYPPYGRPVGWLTPQYPILFQKPASSLISNGENIVLPKISQMVLYEGELVIVIGKEARNVDEVDATGYVYGYSIANDVGAADIEARSSQWASGKMFDTFCPVGPKVVPLEDPGNLAVETKLNGEVVQSGNTREMIFGVGSLISYISCLATLEPGDLILTGSPKQTIGGPDPRIPLIPGDRIEISIEGIGTLENFVVAEEDCNE